MKSSTALIIFGAMGLTAGGIFLWSRRNSLLPVLAGPGVPVGAVNPNSLTQPSQSYPTAIGSGQVDRQDTASQPWATAQTKAVNAQLPSGSIVDQNFLQNVAIAKGTSDIVSSMTSIWDDLNLASLWDDGGSSFVEEDPFEGFDWGVMSGWGYTA